MDFDHALMRALAWCWNGALYACYPRAVYDFWREVGSLPNIVLPATYNDKMFWRRVFDTDPRHAVYCDKLAVKQVFNDLCSELNVPETVWIGSDPADLPTELMSQHIVVKTNNASSRNVSFPQNELNHTEFIKQCRRWLSKPYKAWNREWGYGQIKPLVFAERRIKAKQGCLEDLKIHLFAGQVYYTVIYLGEGKPDSRSAIFNRRGERLQVTNSIVKNHPHRALPEAYRPPHLYGSAMAFAEKIAAGSDYLRVDLMYDGSNLFGGEITVYPTGGRMTNSDPAILADMGRCWKLDLSWFMQTQHTGWRRWYQRLLRRHLRP